MLARDIMTTDVITVSSDTPVPEIARIMAEKGVSGLPVIDEQGCLAGMVSEDDLLLKHQQIKVPYRLALFGLWVVPDEAIADAYKSVRGGLTAADIMTRNVVSFEEDDDVDEIASVMVKKGINRVPIMSGCRLVGIVTRADILRSIAGAGA